MDMLLFACRTEARNNKSVLSRLLWIASALLLTCSTLAHAQQPDAAARSAPTNVLMYASVDIQAIQQFSEQVKSSLLYQALAPGSAQKQRQGPDFTISQIQTMLSLAGAGRVGIALADEDFQTGKPPSLLVIIPVRGREQAQTLARMLSRMAPAAQEAGHDYRGVTITTFSSGLSQGTQSSFAALDDCVLINIGVNTEWLQKAIDANAMRARALAADARFAALESRIAGLGPNAAWAWLNMPRIQQLAMSITSKGDASAAPPAGNIKQPAKPPAPALNPAVLRALYTMYDSAAFRLVLSPQSATVEGLLLINSEDEMGKKVLAQKSGPLRAASLTPDEPILFVGRTDLQLAIDMYRGVLRAADTNSRKMLDAFADSFQKTTGLDLEKDILANLGSEAALALNSPSPDLKSVPILIYVQTKDREAMRRTMQMLSDAMGKAMNMHFIQKDVPHGRIYQLNRQGSSLPILPGWTLADDFLVIGTTPDALETALNLAAGKGDGAFASSPAYRQVVADAGDRLASVFLLSMQKIADLMDKIPLQQLGAKPDQTAPRGTQSSDTAKVQRIIHALNGLSAVTALEKDGITIKMTLTFDLNK